MIRRFISRRAAAVLALAALAACDTSAVTTPEIRAEAPARTSTAPVLTVTSSGGHPLVSWAALPGATSYSVVYRWNWTDLDKATLASRTGTVDTPLGSTTGTSFLDTSHAYTGVSRCTAYGTFTTRFTFHTYRVTATFADGTSATSSIAAPVAPC